MNFLLQAGNFQMEQPIPFQTIDQSAKAKEIFDYLSQGFQGQNISIGYALPDGSQGYLDPNQDLKQIFEANAQLFIMIDDQNAAQNVAQNDPQNPVAGQNIPVNTFVVEGGENKQIAQEYLDPALYIGQYVIQLGQLHNIIVESICVFDHEGKGLTDDQNLQFGNFMNYPYVNLVITPSQQQPIQINPQINKGSLQSPIQPGTQNDTYLKPLQDPQANISNLQPVPATQQMPAMQQVPAMQPPATNQQVGLSIDQRVQQIKDSVVILKNMTLYFDPSGEFITYQYHYPIQLTGSIRKSQTTSNQKFSNSKNTWQIVHNKKYELAQLDEFSFGIKWEGGNSSRLRIKQQ